MLLPKKNTKKFEIKFGKAGVTVLIIGTSLLVCVAFIGGIIVSTDIDNMPSFIARDIPARIVNYIMPNKTTPTEIVIANLTNTNATIGNDSNTTLNNVAIQNDNTKNSLTQATNINNSSSGNKTKSREEIVAGKFVVQLGVFKERRNADKLFKRLTKAKYNIRLALVNNEKEQTNYEVVFADGFKSEKEARRYAKTVSRKFKNIQTAVISSKKFHLVARQDVP
ncbi:MAG: SPOR domain-containing protein [Deltaproteobacteria bacterium]